MNNLNILLKGALGRKVPAEFSTENYDYESALRDEIKKLAGNNIYSFEKNKYEIFELISSELSEILPQRVIETIGMFCEVIQVPQGSRLEFHVRKGHQRGKQFVTRATESGVYEQFRLDHDHFDVYPVTLGGAAGVDFERYLDGIEDMNEVFEILQEGFIDRLYEMVQGCLLESWNKSGRPARNKVAVNGFDTTAMRELCNTVAPYGSPIIYCSPEFASEMINAVVYDTKIKIPEVDVTDIRERGYIGKFYGTPIVVLPQSFVDENNEKLAMNPSFAYVIPSGKEKLIKIGFEGSPIIREWDNRDNSKEIQMYEKVGVGMINRPNYWGIYYNAALDEGSGWEEFNKGIVADEDIFGGREPVNP